MASHQPTFAFAPSATEIDKFLVLLLASGLVHFSELRDACADFDTERSDEHALDDLCKHLVTKHLISQWQGDKLRKGKWKGFYVDDYRLLDSVNSTAPSDRTFLAEDVSTGRRVELSVRRLEAPPWFEYSVATNVTKS